MAKWHFDTASYVGSFNKQKNSNKHTSLCRGQLPDDTLPKTVENDDFVINTLAIRQTSSDIHKALHDEIIDKTKLDQRFQFKSNQFTV